MRFWNSNQKDRFCPLSASKRTAGAYLKDAKVLAKVKTTPMDDKTTSMDDKTATMDDKTASMIYI